MIQKQTENSPGMILVQVFMLRRQLVDQSQHLVGLFHRWELELE
jgi:hypothetical protein